MIRFSAALVVVAIGVLIGGVATSKLLFVYLAILVSAVALVALAIGVVLKRKELFGEWQAPASAVAGDSPGSPVTTGSPVSNGDSQDRVSQHEWVASPPPSPFPGTAATADRGQPGYGWYAYNDGRHAPGDPSNRTDSGSSDAPASPAAPWETRTSGEPWSVTARDRNAQPSWAGFGGVPSAGNNDAGLLWSAELPWSSRQRPGDRSAPSWQSATPAYAPTSGAGRHAAASAQPVATQPPSAHPESAPTQSAPTQSAPKQSSPGGDLGSGASVPSWFDRPVKVAVADTAATAAADPAAGAEVDDWPTRYPWLDVDETSEPADATTASKDDEDAPADRDEPADPPPADPPAPASLATEPPATESPAVKLVATESPAVETGDDEDSTAAAAKDEVRTDEAHDDSAAADDPADDDTVDDDTANDDAAADDTPHDVATDEADPSTSDGTTFVTVVPGVPRYHKGDCILIRFMPADGVQQVTVPEAKQTGCTPCAACQPED